MSNIIPFQFENSEIRTTLDLNGEPLFVAKDVAEALGYNWDRNLTKHVPDEWKGVNPIHTPGGTQQMAVLTEQGLYFFLGRSDKPKALPFQKWLAGEVVPSIRKTGHYGDPKAPTVVLKTLPAQALKLMPDAMKAAKAMGFKGNQAILSANKAVTAIAGVNVLELMGQAALPAPDQDSLLTVSDIAKRLEWAVRAVNPRITLAGLQDEHRDHKNNLYYELTDLGHGFGVYLDTGKKHSNGTPVRQIKWRGAILDYLRNHYADESSATRA